MHRYLLIFLSAIPYSLFAATLPLDKLGLDSTKRLSFTEPGHEVIIAVIDDGFALDHPALRGMLWHNPGEIAYNGQDDDRNGYVDDRNGWDIADMDGELVPPKPRLKDFNHGTYSAAMIADILRAKLGDQENYPIKLMLVKAISDQTINFSLAKGYDGIRYAVENGASIVSNAWSGGPLSTDDSQALNFARGEGVLLINSVGNYPTDQPSMPAAHPAVLGVAAVDRNGILIKQSNYGEEVDIVSIAQDISGVSLVDDGVQTHSGTSVAVPVIAATSGLMKLINPKITADEIRDCLINTAHSVDPLNPNVAAKLGAGLIQIDAAIDCAGLAETGMPIETYINAKGSLRYSHRSNGGQTFKKWRIKPLATGQRIRLQNSIEGTPAAASINIHGIDGEPLQWQGKLSGLPDNLQLPANGADIELNVPVSNSAFRLTSRYAVMPLDHEKKFCSGKTQIEKQTRITDGSGDEPYVAESNCKWLIRSRPGQAIRIRFSQLDIDAQTDKLYLFRGDTTAQTNFLVSLTGNQLPPGYIVQDGDVLIWFLSDTSRQAQGFSAQIDWVDKENSE